MDLLSPRHDCGLRQTSHATVLPAARRYCYLHAWRKKECTEGCGQAAQSERIGCKSGSLPATSTACTGIISTLTSLVNTVTVDV